MEKVQMFRTTDGSLFETETEALKHEAMVRHRNVFEQLYEQGDLWASGNGRVYPEDLIEWAFNNHETLSALASLVLGSEQ